jgi:succinate dehydrogenase / fumarate reductase cytochrome b subunit
VLPSAVATWIAGSGALLVVFLVVHLGGVGLAVLRPAAFEAYATALHQSAWLLPAEGLLGAALLGHLGLTAWKVVANRRAGNRAGLVSRRADRWGAWAARSLPLSAGILLLFLGVHLAQLRWPRPPAGLELARLLELLGAPGWGLLYGAAGVAAGLHLFHGAEAAHRSLGLLHPSYGRAIRAGGRAVALLLGAGFLLVTLLLNGQAVGWLA